MILSDDVSKIEGENGAILPHSLDGKITCYMIEVQHADPCLQLRWVPIPWRVPTKSTEYSLVIELNAPVSLMGHHGAATTTDSIREYHENIFS